jgi:hypothetical protein
MAPPGTIGNFCEAAEILTIVLHLCNFHGRECLFHRANQDTQPNVSFIEEHAQISFKLLHLLS